MSVRTDTVNLIVNVNGNKGQADLNNLRKKAADLRLEMKGVKEGTEEYINKASELKNVTSEMDALKKQIGITSLSQKELRAELNKLKALKGSVIPLSEEYEQLGKEIKKVENRLFDVRYGTTGFSRALSKLSTEVKQFGVVAAAYLGFQFITQQFQNIIRGAGKLSDQLADLQRVAGLTGEEAKSLNQKLTELNTRTSTEGLREIAIIAGKLGVAKDDIFGFTKAVDQLVVSLGDELGNADQITTQLGKILNVFDGKVTGDNITKLGNAFVELANTGAATGGFIADFDQRLSGIAKSSGIGLGALSGLGAGLEELGAKVESSSTSIQKLVVKIASDIPGAAKVAGISTQEFNKLFATDGTEAILRYSEGLIKNRKSFAAVVDSLKDAGEEGARTVETITKLGVSAEVLRKRIDLGKKSIEESSAITAAFTLKNETFGASIDKLGKVFNRLVTSSSVTSFLKSALEGFLKVITPAESLTDAFRKQAAIVNKLQTDTLPLINRYEELKKKSTLNKDEQIELNKAITAIGNTIPGAITQFDAYGRALGINADKAREFINLQKAILKEKNRAAILDQEDQLKRVEQTVKIFQTDLSVRNATGDLVKTVLKQGEYVAVKLTAAEIAETQQRLNDAQDRLKGIKGIIDELRGEAKNAPITDNKKTDQILALPGATDEEKKAAEKAAKDKQNELERLRKEYEKFYADLLKLKEKAQIKGEEPEQAEIDAAKAKYAELTARALEYYKQRIITSTQFGEDEKLITAAQQQELQNIFNKYQKKRFDETSSKEYEDSLAARTEFSDKLKIAAANDFAAGKISKKEYEDGLKQIERDELKDRIIIANDYSSTVKKAAADVTQFKKVQEKQTTADAIEEANKRIELSNSEALAKAQRAVLTSRPGTDARFEANEALLKLQFDQEAKSLDKKSELYKLKEAELNEALSQLKKDRLQQDIDQVLEYVQYFQSALNSLNQFITNKENAQLARDKVANDKKKNNYKSQLDNKLISQEQYNKKVQVVDEDQAKKEREVRRKQAERDKALGIFNAIIDNAAAILKTMTSVPFPLNIPLAIAQGIAGGLQIAAISNTPLPELGTGDWIRTGNKHTEGGINANIERDEAVIKASAMTSPEVLTVTGNAAQITSAINSRAGGTSWASGAQVQAPGWRTEAPANLNPKLLRVMADGGILNSTAISTANSFTSETNSLLQQLVIQQANTAQEIRTMKTRLQAVVSIKDIDDTRNQYELAQKVSSLNV